MSLSEESYKIKRYVEGRLSPSEQNAFEGEMLNDPFLMEAVEGYQLFPGALADLENLARQGLNSGHTSFNFWLSCSFGLLAFASLMGLFTITFEGKEKETAELEAPVSKPEVLLPDEEVLELTAMPDKRLEISPAQTVKDQRAIEKEDYDLRVAASKISVEPMAKKNTKNSLGEVPVGELAENILESTMHDLKIVDYTSIRQAKGSGQSRPEPYYRNVIYNPQDFTLPERNTEIEVPYVEFLDGAMFKYAKGRFARALEDFEVILKFYPDDNNALFYGGLCKYNLGRYTAAFTYFKKVEDHYIVTFNQEAQWYRALSAKENGNREEAIQILSAIIKQDGFYADRARELVKGM